MSTHNPKNIALETWDLCRGMLPPHIVENLTVPPSDPQPLKKKDADIMRLRILPKRKHPVQFWSSSWCFYEIGVGSYGRGNGTGLNIGGISFVQFPNQKACGEGRYLRSVSDIVRGLQRQRNTEFEVVVAGEAGAVSTQLFRRYMTKSSPQFPVQIAAEDLAWLIQHSLPKFEAISP